MVRVSVAASAGVSDGVMVQVAAYSVAQRRREWSYFEKRAILKAAFAPGACVAEGARRAEVRMSLIYRWRKTLAAIGNRLCLGQASRVW
jgi:transposase-like protein